MKIITSRQQAMNTNVSRITWNHQWRHTYSIAQNNDSNLSFALGNQILQPRLIIPTQKTKSDCNKSTFKLACCKTRNTHSENILKCIACVICPTLSCSSITCHPNFFVTFVKATTYNSTAAIASLSSLL